MSFVRPRRRSRARCSSLGRSGDSADEPARSLSPAARPAAPPRCGSRRAGLRPRGARGRSRGLATGQTSEAPNPKDLCCFMARVAVAGPRQHGRGSCSPLRPRRQHGEGGRLRRDAFDSTTSAGRPRRRLAGRPLSDPRRQTPAAGRALATASTGGTPRAACESASSANRVAPGEATASGVFVCYGQSGAARGHGQAPRLRDCGLSQPLLSSCTLPAKRRVGMEIVLAATLPMQAADACA